MGFADGFLKGTQARILKQQAKAKEKKDKLDLKMLGLKIGQLSDKIISQKNLFKPPEFGNLSQSGAVAAREEQVNPRGLIGGSDAPPNASVTGQMADLQLNRQRDLVQSGLLGEFQKLQTINQGKEARSPEGRQAQDLIEFASKFGENSPELELLKAQLGGSGPKLELFKAGGAERGRFLRFSTDNITSLGSFDKIARAATDASGAGDIAIMFNFMKLLDPGSRVTSGETALAEQVSGSASQFLNLFNRVMLGQRLTAPARQDILFQSGQIAGDLVEKQHGVEEQFTGIATRAGINPDDIVFFRKQVQATADSLVGLEKPERSLAQTAKAAEEGLSGFVEGIKEVVGDAIGPSIEEMDIDQILKFVSNPDVSEADVDKATARIKALTQ